MIPDSIGFPFYVLQHTLEATQQHPFRQGIKPWQVYAKHHRLKEQTRKYIAGTRDGYLDLHLFFFSLSLFLRHINLSFYGLTV